MRAAAHLGVFEGGMVSYLVKSGSSRSARFTREGTQLDAYCSALGKVLVAHLPAFERNAYLSGGPFPKLTNQTITDPRELGVQLRQVRRQSYAIDDREFAEEVMCIAVPVRDRNSRVYAALSITASPEELRGSRAAAALRLLRRAASDIERCMNDQRRALRKSADRRGRTAPGRAA
jgi:DNA-binding IclR family transcriptional regulator